MKKIGIIIFSILFALLLPTTVLSAEEETLSPSSNGSSSTSTSITVETVAISKPEFTLSIPSTIPIGTLERSESDSIKSVSFEVGVSELTYLNGKQIQVSVSAENGFYLFYNDYRLPYQVYNQETGGTPLANDSVFHVFERDETIKGRLEINEADIRASGTYGGSMIFTVSVVQPQS
ncbi:MAG: hypothetical protein E7666_04180 [Ruminococcaceae bacterium]|nr:hypothetical protein [Oscillospiraceae bacterium]